MNAASDNYLKTTNYGTFIYYDWKAAFDDYTRKPLPLDGAIAGDYVVHLGIPGVAVYLGRESVDRVVFHYAEGIKKFNTAKVDLDRLVREATDEEVEASGLDADAIVSNYSQSVAAEAHAKRAAVEALAAQEIEVVKESEESATGYFSQGNFTEALDYLSGQSMEAGSMFQSLVNNLENEEGN